MNNHKKGCKGTDVALSLEQKQPKLKDYEIKKLIDSLVKKYNNLIVESWNEAYENLELPKIYSRGDSRAGFRDIVTKRTDEL